jgi:hypothetical protein
MHDMLGVIFYEQRSIATEIGLIEVPCYLLFKSEAGTDETATGG